MPGKAILHRKNVFCNLSRHTIASIKAIHIIESSHPREDFLFPRPQAHQQINPAAAMQHTTTRFQVCTDRSQVLFNSGGNDYGILQLCDRSSSDPGCGPGCGPGCLGCHQSSGRLWQRQPRLQESGHEAAHGWRWRCSGGHHPDSPAERSVRLSAAGGFIPPVHTQSLYLCCG